MEWEGWHFISQQLLKWQCEDYHSVGCLPDERRQPPSVRPIRHNKSVSEVSWSIGRIAKYDVSELVQVGHQTLGGNFE